MGLYKQSKEPVTAEALKEMKAMRLAGATLREIKYRFPLRCESTLSFMLGPEVRREWRVRQRGAKNHRLEEAKAMREAGATFAEIGKKLGITYERARQLLKGMKRPPAEKPPIEKQPRKRRERKKAAAEKSLERRRQAAAKWREKNRAHYNEMSRKSYAWRKYFKAAESCLGRNAPEDKVMALAVGIQEIVRQWKENDSGR